ncbi:MAG: hypothetical protein PHI86_01535 [Candidatus Omnitrophica bacterium]|nr:hypothetical protein [Candidatus Omnitrophota bacterium]HOX54300.1 hypothetical protein [Candidatus Omnitrophota bacterium]
MLRRFFRGKRAQSTAEYGILFAAVIAIAAGALTVSLKNAVQSKHDKSLEYFLKAGNDDLTAALEGAGSTQEIYSTGEEIRKTVSSADGFRDTKVRTQGGGESVMQTQNTSTDQVSMNKIVAGSAAPAP